MRDKSMPPLSFRGPMPVRRWTSSAQPAAGASQRVARAVGSVRDLPGIDANLYLFALCRQLQMTCLDRHGIDCLVDAEGIGRLPAPVCRMLGLAISELVEDISACAHDDRVPAAVAVTLRRRGAACLCTVVCRGLRDACTDGRPGVQRVRHLAAEFDGGCAVRAMPERATVAVMVDIGQVERDFPAVFWRYRANEAWRSPRQHHPRMLE